MRMHRYSSPILPHLAILGWYWSGGCQKGTQSHFVSHNAPAFGSHFRGAGGAGGAMPGLKSLTISPGQAPDDPKMTVGNQFLIRGRALWCNAQAELPNHLGLPTPRTTRK
jgi:hypothetical protein